MCELISVVMSAYNENEKDLRQSIESILNQSYKNIEFIIILDNPDNHILLDVITSYSEIDNRIRVIVNDKNLGLPCSLNKGIQLSKGEYIARMDADDISLPDRLQTEVEYLKKHNLDMVAALKIDIDENENLVEKKYLEELSYIEIKQLLPLNNFIAHPTVLFKKRCIVDLGGYRMINSAEDYDLWLRLLNANGHIGLIDKFLLKYRVRSNGISRSDLFKQLLVNEFLRKSYEKGILETVNLQNEIEKHLKKNNYYDKHSKMLFNKYYSIFLSGLQKIKRREIITGSIFIIKSLLINRHCRRMFYSFVEYKFRFRKLKYKRLNP